LGWFGKNNCLITPGHGSWVALAEVVTEAALTPEGSQPPHSQCGDCTACLRACPTGALIAPFAQRADRCLSFLTTELRGPIPRALRPLLGTRVLGCDSCQSICPKNADKTVAQPSADEGGLPPWLDLTAVLALDERAFAAKYGGTAAARAKRAGLLRNAAVALGNAGDSDAVTVLSRALSDHEPLVRGHAAWALGRLGGQLARRALGQALGSETEGWVREEIDDALGCAP
jgi:epoxyqueuosine reductase